MKTFKNIVYFLNKGWVKKVIIGIEILLIIITTCIAMRLYHLNSTLIPYYEKKLQKKLDDQINSISTFLNLQRQNVEYLSADEQINKFMHQRSKGEGKLLPSPESLTLHVKKLQENIGFKSLSLIANNGVVLFSTNPLLRNVRLNDEAYSNTPLFRSFHAASLTLTADFSDFLYSSIIKEPAFYITAPLFFNNIIIGTIAYQIDDMMLYRITRDYLDLGKTGEIVLAVQTGINTYFITPTRNNPTVRFTKSGLFSRSDFLAVQKAALGEKSYGITIDYLGQETLATWSFIPRVDWGIVVKINLDEIKSPWHTCSRYLLISALCTIFFSIFTFIIHRRHFPARVEQAFGDLSKHFPHKLKYSLIILLIVFAYLSAFSIYQLKDAVSTTISEAQESAKEEVGFGIQAINADLERIQLLGDFIAQDLRTERLISEDIRKRLRREIVETEGLVRITIAYKPADLSANKRLYAPSIAEDQDGVIREEMIEQFYDYTNKYEGIKKTQWYTLPMETKKAQWLNPSFDSLRNEMIITYSLPFFFANEQNSPAGVISIDYKLSQFAEIAQNIGIGPTGYSFLISHDGTFLYHPIEQNFTEQKTLLQFAQEEGNENLEHIANEIKAEKPILTQFMNTTTQSKSWIYTHPIPIAGWTIATVISASEVGISGKAIKKYIFIIIIYLTCMFLFMSFAFARSYTRNTVYSFINFSNLILICTQLSLWYTIAKTIDVERKDQILVTDQSSVNKFVHRQTEEAERKNEPAPVPIPCGVELYSLEETSPTRVSFSGYIWHKYHKNEHQEIQRTIRIPQVISFSVLNQTTITEGDWDTVGLNVTATLYHEHDFATYPFDNHHIIIPLEHAHLTKNILLVPDLAGYSYMDPYKLPGLDTTYSLNKFNAKETFFNYTPYQPSTDSGVLQYVEITNQYRLAYNAILKNDLFVSFVYFFLPLLAILISIFGVLVLEQRETSPYTMIGPYTGLFFALVLLHRSLHEKAPSAQTLYIEYGFFYAYIVIILLVVHTILVQRFAKNDTYQEQVVPFLKIIFWPLQLSAWIITTLVIFY